MNSPKQNQVYLLICALGLWLLVAPATFGYKSIAMACSDHFIGTLLIALGFCSLFFRPRILLVILVLAGLWLQLAPLLFWAPTPDSFLNDTLIGFIVLSLAFTLPALQGLPAKESGGNPPGWSFNPSDWTPRICTIFLAMFCWFLSRYLSAYQLGYISTIWDPFFGDASTIKVVTSNIAKSFPVSDAGLGALCYSLEAFMGWQGNHQRWRTMPWMVIFFGLLVVPAGLVSILLIILQPLIVGAWCGLCLCIAACMLTMIMLTISEVVAAVQFLFQAYSNGQSFWKVFWKGSESNGVSKSSGKGSGVSYVWSLAATAAIGLWLMLSPYFFHMKGMPLSDSNYIAGPLLITFSLISMAEVARPLRYINSIIGLSLIVSQWILSGIGSDLAWNNLFFGLVVISLSFRKGAIGGRYGSWNRFIV